VAVAALPRTLAAITAFIAVAGETGALLLSGQIAARVLMDPTFGTLTTLNPNATNPAAGPLAGVFNHEIQQIITAVEQIEAGSGRGERPAVLVNASATPASFGRGQLIGGTAVDTLRHNPAFAASYGLGAAARGELDAIARNTVAHYNHIFGLVAAGGVSEAALLGLVQAYVTSDGARFHRETGLFDSDLTSMFRIAQFRRHVAARPHTVTPDVYAGNLLNAQQSPAAATNIAALGFTLATVRHYVRTPDHLGENRQGFVTRALFHSPHGQMLRDAMTDAGGIAIGRQLIADDHALVVRRAAALHIALSLAQRSTAASAIASATSRPCCSCGR
jgi:hypothetical protein